MKIFLVLAELHLLIANGSRDFPLDVTALQQISRDQDQSVTRDNTKTEENEVSALDAVSERKCKKRRICV